MTSEAPGRQLTALTLGATLAVVSVAQAVLAMDTTVVAIALPRIRDDLDATNSSLVWIPNAYLMAIAGSMPLWGGIGDRWGRQRILLTGLSLFALGSLISAIAEDLPMLVAGRGVQGLGAGAIFAIGLSLLTAVFPAQRLNAATGVWVAATAAGMCVGPPIGALLELSLGWRSIFWINVPVAVLAVVVGWRNIPDSRDPERRSADLVGGLLFLVTVCLVIWGLHLVEDILLGASAVGTLLATLSVASLVSILLVLRERRARYPVIPPRLLGHQAFRTLAIAGFLVTFSHVSVLFLETFDLQADRGWDPLSTGLMLLPLSLGIVAGGFTSARLGTLFGPQRVVAAGLLATAVGLALLTGLTWGLPPVIIALANALIGFGSGAALPIVSASAMLSVPHDGAATASAVLNTARQFGGAVGMAVLLIGTTWLVLSIGADPLPTEVNTTSQTPIALPGQRALIVADQLSDSTVDLALSAAFSVSTVAALLAVMLAWRGMRMSSATR